MLLNICCFSRDITADIAMVVNFVEEQQEPEAPEVSLEYDEL